MTTPVIDDFEADPRELLAATARDLYGRGWMAGTAGNLSLRQPDGSFWVTASGKAKGSLARPDFLRMALDGEVLERGRPDDRPSAETSLHQALYGLFPQARACYHVHSIAANLASRLTDGDDLPLPPIEMIKGLGVWDENPEVSLAVLPNHGHVPKIAAELVARFRSSPPRLPGFLIRDHGLTVWADDARSALHYLELFEFVFGCAVAARTAGIRWSR